MRQWASNAGSGLAGRSISPVNFAVKKVRSDASLTLTAVAGSTNGVVEGRIRPVGVALDEFRFVLEREADVVFGAALERQVLGDFRRAIAALDPAGEDAVRADGPVDLIGRVLEVVVVAQAFGVEDGADVRRVVADFGDGHRRRFADFGAGWSGAEREQEHRCRGARRGERRRFGREASPCRRRPRFQSPEPSKVDPCFYPGCALNPILGRQLRRLRLRPLSCTSPEPRTLRAVGELYII